MAITQEYKKEWSFLEKLIFKYIFTYLSLYIFLKFFSTILETPIRSFGKLLNIKYSYEANGFGSGDHTYAYVTLFMNFILAIVITFLWGFFLDRNRKSYNKLLYWFLVVLRIYLIFFMFTYGFIKIFQLQFPFPSLTRFLEPLGNSSPMGLAWTYLGYSKGFNLFMGLMEVLGGILLIPRRTSTLGSFIIVGVMSHVAIMNFMYDIPVKIFSTHLTLIALFIFSTDIKRFINVFIKNKPVSSYNFYNPILHKTYHQVIFWLKLIFTLLLGGLMSLQAFSQLENNKPHLYGIWETEYFIKNNDTIKPLITNKEYWRYLIIEYENNATIKMIDDSKEYYNFKIDTILKTALIRKSLFKSNSYNFKYSNPNSEILKLNGITIYGDTLNVKFKKKNLDDFLLYSRGFNWINERPFNR